MPFSDKTFCCNRLWDMQDALSNRDQETAESLMETLSCYSLDHDLDIILIRAKLTQKDFDGAVPLRVLALHHCARSMQK